MTDPNPASILDSVKKVLGFDPDYTAFDLDITMHINSAFGALWQVGVGGDEGFMISDNTTLWSQYVSSLSYLGMIQQFIYLSVRMAFDTPNTSFVIGAIEKQVEQLLWRINIAAEHINPPTDPFAPVDAGPGAGTTTTYFKVISATLAFAATVTPNAGEANTFYLTADDDCTINAPVSGTDAEHITLFLTTGDGAGITWGEGWNFGGAGVPELSGNNHTDIISAVYRQSEADWYAGFAVGF
jgi:hypothetical protein